LYFAVNTDDYISANSVPVPLHGRLSSRRCYYLCCITLC